MLSLVVPAHNEENFIEDTLGTLDATIQGENLPYEIVVVDDGSQDNTLAKARSYAKSNGHIKVVSYAENVGKGHAVKTGFMRTNGDVVIFVDSDMEIDLNMVSKYIEALEYSDIVIASKKHPNSSIEMPLSRRILSSGFNTLVRLLTGLPLKDTQSGFKAMKKSSFAAIFPQLAIKRYAFDVELLAVAYLNGLRIVEMPVKINLNAKFKIKQIWLMFIDLLAIAYRLRVIHWYQGNLSTKMRFNSIKGVIPA